MKNSKTLKIILLLLLVFTIVSCVPKENMNNIENLTTVKLPMGYIPDIQQAPVYVAENNGYFDQTGYSFEFDYSFETDGIALVAAGEVPFAFGSGEQVLLAREQGLDVVYVLAWYQEYPVGIIALKESGIKELSDLVGQKVGIPGAYGANYIALRAMLMAVSIDEDDLKLESIGYNQAEALITGIVDAASVYINNTPVQLQHQGYETIIFPVSDYVQLASNGLITSKKMIEENPQAVANMVDALIKGITETIENPDEAFAISKNYVETLELSNQETQKNVLTESIKLWETENIGYIQSNAWINMMETLVEMGLLSKTLDLNEAYTNEFIK